jgi:hypothetical protein
MLPLAKICIGLLTLVEAQDLRVILPQRNLRQPQQQHQQQHRRLKKDKGGEGFMPSPGNGRTDCVGIDCLTDVQILTGTTTGGSTTKTVCNDPDCQAAAAAQSASARQVPLSGGNSTGTNVNGTATGNNAIQEAMDQQSQTACAGPGCESSANTTKTMNFRWFKCRGFDCYKFTNVGAINGDSSPSQSSSSSNMTDLPSAGNGGSSNGGIGGMGMGMDTESNSDRGKKKGKR